MRTNPQVDASGVNRRAKGANLVCLNIPKLDSLKARPGEHRNEYWDRALHGFGVRVYSNGRKTFTVRYSLHGDQRAETRWLAGDDSRRQRDRVHFEGPRPLEERVKRKARLLSEAHQRLKILDDAKNDFLSLIAHELRTPVTGALGATEALASGDLDEDGRRAAIELLRHVIDRLLAIVEEALLLTSVSASVEGLSPRNHQLGPLWAAACERASKVATTLGVEIASPPDDLGSVLCDEILLPHALAAILECAAKFSQPGGKVRATRGGDGASLQIRIEATGYRIPEEAVPTFSSTCSPWLGPSLRGRPWPWPALGGADPASPRRVCCPRPNRRGRAVYGDPASGDLDVHESWPGLIAPWPPSLP